MKRFILVLAILLLLPLTSLADPSPGISWLQREPLSLFDFGMERAEQSFEKYLKGGSWIMAIWTHEAKAMFPTDPSEVEIAVEASNRGLSDKLSKERKKLLREAIRSGSVVAGEDGKLKIAQKLDSKKQPSIYLSGIVKSEFSHVNYDFEKNKLLFETLIIIERAERDSSSSIKELRNSRERQKIENKRRKLLVNPEACELILKSIKQRFLNAQGFNSKNPEEDWFREMFSHSGFKKKSRPKSLEKELVRMSEITVHLGFSSILAIALNGKYPVSCSLPFAGGPISVTKNSKIY